MRKKRKSSSRPLQQTTPTKVVRGYILNERRTPKQPLLKLPPTLSQTIGPFYPAVLIRPQESDLTLGSGSHPPAGEVIGVTGVIVDETGRAVPGALLEIWQANAYGRYRHKADQSSIPLDPHFNGVGRLQTDENGRYFLKTIKPGGYPNPGYDNWVRPPHVHFSIFGAGLMDRLITQMYFPGEPLNEPDLILNGIGDKEVSDRLISRKTSEPESNHPTYVFDIVLRGGAETPFFTS